MVPLASAFSALPAHEQTRYRLNHQDKAVAFSTKAHKIAARGLLAAQISNICLVSAGFSLGMSVLGQKTLPECTPFALAFTSLITSCVRDYFNQRSKELLQVSESYKQVAQGHTITQMR